MQVRCGVVLFQIECVLLRIDSRYSDCRSWSFPLMTVCSLDCASFGRIDLFYLSVQICFIRFVNVPYLDLGSLVSLVSHVGS